jgi:hypothetical protein
VLTETRMTVTQKRLSEATGAAAVHSVGWRLLGSNHRELGRSGGLFRSVDHAVAAITAMRASVADLETAVLADLDACSWFWCVYLGSAPAAVSSRFYQRRRESADGLRRAVDKIAEAAAEPEVVRPRRATHREGRADAVITPRPVTPVVELRSWPVRQPGQRRAPEFTASGTGLDTTGSG